jgi:hypothetical protein
VPVPFSRSESSQAIDLGMVLSCSTHLARGMGTGTGRVRPEPVPVPRADREGNSPGLRLDRALADRVS